MSDNEKSIPEAELSEEKLDGVTGGANYPWEEQTTTIVYYKCPHCQEETSETTYDVMHCCSYCLKPFDKASAKRREQTYTRKGLHLPFKLP